MLERAVGVRRSRRAPGRRRRPRASPSATSISPEPIRAPTVAGGRSSATASPVTRSSGVSIANSGDDIAITLGSRRVDLDAYVLAHHAEWERLEALTRKRRLDGRESDELVERYQRVATHLSVIRTAAPDATRDHLPLAAPEPRAQPVRRRAAPAPGTASAPSSPSASRPPSTGCAGGGSGRRGQRRGRLRDDVVAARPPRHGAEPALAARRRPAGQPRLRRLLQPVRRVPLRRRGLDQQRRGSRRCAWPSERSGCRSCTCCSRTSRTSRSSARS